jgi:hypothetical protein
MNRTHVLQFAHSSIFFDFGQCPVLFLLSSTLLPELGFPREAFDLLLIENAIDCMEVSRISLGIPEMLHISISINNIDIPLNPRLRNAARGVDKILRRFKRSETGPRYGIA